MGLLWAPKTDWMKSICDIWLSAFLDWGMPPIVAYYMIANHAPFVCLTLHFPHELMNLIFWKQSVIVLS